MSDNWQRRRSPDDVPTPIAVALSDFCRRAQGVAPATVVREALALLDEGDDFRVRSLTEGEPEATPLGPFAVVDIIRGTDAQLAASREKVGYYELVREVAELRHNPPAPPPPVEAFYASAAPWSDESVSTSSSPAVPASTVAITSRPKDSVSARIAPQKRVRSASSDESSTDPNAVPLVDDEPRKSLPAPKGRYTRLSPTKVPFTELRTPAGADLLTAMVEQHPNRYELLRNLSEQFLGGTRGPLTDGEVMDTLRLHRLDEKLAAKERNAVISAVTEHRGAFGRASWAMGLTQSEFTMLVETLGLTKDTNDVRERFRRDALSPQNLSYRLDLLGRVRYLTDLDIKRRFSDSLTGDLRKLAAEAAPDAGSYEALLKKISRDQGVSTELLDRALDKLGLANELKKKLSRNTGR